MNIVVTFHNRKKLDEQFKLKAGTNQCLFCGYQYNPKYTSSQNAFALIGCQKHLGHRQCLLRIFEKGKKPKYIECQLCKRVKEFDWSEERVKQRQRLRKIYEIEYEPYDCLDSYEYAFEDIERQVEKKGRYKPN